MSLNKNLEQEPFIWLDYQTDNFEDFSKTIQSWSIDFLQLDGGKFHTHLQQLIFPEVEITQAYFDCHLDQKGTSPEDKWTFAIMGENSSMFMFNHKMTKSTSTMIIYTPGQEINGVTYEGFHVYPFSIERSHFKKLTQNLGMNEIEEKLSSIDRVELKPQQADALREQLKDILTNVSDLKHKVITQEGKNLLLHFLPLKFLKVISENIGCTREIPIKEKDLLFMEIRTYIHTHIHKQITVAGLAKKFKFSERSLRNYFNEELNISPKQYLTILRLTKVRDELKVQNMEKGLVDYTARKFGFQHMGPFSKTYKEYFGELPSETLKRTPIQEIIHLK